MEDVVVGQDSLELHDVVRAIEASSSFASLLQNWRGFSHNLGVSDVMVLDMERKLNLGIFQMKDLPREIVKIWKAEKGNKATLQVLRWAIVDCGVNDIAESLFAIFFPPKSVGAVKFIWQGKVMTLEELLGGNISQETCQNICDELKNHFQSKPFQLVKDHLTPPAPPDYYISRELLYVDSTEVDNAIFLSSDYGNQDHIFLFKGMKRPDLAKLTKYSHRIDSSGKQLYNVTVRFILLECDDDFDRICKRTTKPVHMIRSENGRYIWQRSNKNLDFIRHFLKEKGRGISEPDMVSRITSSCAVSIADSPGMGKTMMLADFAAKIQEEESTIVLFIVLQEFIAQLPQVDSSPSALEAIVEYSTSNRVTQLVLVEMMKSGLYQVYLFFDGYDEVSQDKLDMVDSFLIHLRQVKNSKVIITTRLHIRSRLESIFQQFSYEIKPFDESNQIDFLTKYWVTQYGMEENEKLNNFAKHCLTALTAKLTDKENEIAGIPLQCMMVAEVFAEDAKRALSLDTLPSENVPYYYHSSVFCVPSQNTVTPIPFFQMYEKLMKLKFKRIEEQEESTFNNYLNAHVHQAIILLFPEWGGAFQSILNDHNEIDEATLYSIGILEKGPNNPRFVHRTFAEYLLAEFIVKNLGKHKECADFLFGAVLGRDGITVRKEYVNYLHFEYYEMNYPVTAYFIEMHLSRYMEHSYNYMHGLFLSDYSTSTRLDVEDICVAVRACCSNDLESTFEYATKVLHSKIGERQRNRYFKDLSHLVVRLSNFVTMLEKFLEFTRKAFRADMSYHTLKDVSFSYPLVVQEYTPLHAAVSYGKYNFAQYLVQEYGVEHVKNLKYLLHLCLDQSAYNSDSVIDDKLSIIEMLVDINPHWLEKGEHEWTPMLQDYIHLSLLKRVVELGADINTFDRSRGTILHRSFNWNGPYIDLASWAFSKGFKLINKRDQQQATPLMLILQRVQNVENQVLELFQEAGADFNAKDNYGNSVLFHALQGQGKVGLIRKLIGYGADVNYRSSKLKQNPLHKLMEGYGSSEDRIQVCDMLVRINPGWLEEKDIEGCTPLIKHYFDDVQLLQRLLEHGADINAYDEDVGTILHRNRSKDAYTEFVRWAIANGFKLVNHTRRCFKITPLMHAIEKYWTVEDEVLELFQKAGADFKANDAKGDSVLFYALQYSGNMDFIRKLMEYGADNLNHRNGMNQNALHKVLHGQGGSINERMLIVDMLLATNRNWLEEKDKLGCKPFLQEGVDKRLLEHLAQNHGYDNIDSNESTPRQRPALVKKATRF